MQYTKAMVDLIQEARRRVPSEQKPSIKLANPDVFDELTDLYLKSKDNVFKALIKELFYLAGDPWPERLIPREAATSPPQSNNPRYTTRVYRGQTILQKRPNLEDQVVQTEPQPNRPKKIYRGQVIA